MLLLWMVGECASALRSARRQKSRGQSMHAGWEIKNVLQSARKKEDAETVWISVGVGRRRGQKAVPAK